MSRAANDNVAFHSSMRERMPGLSTRAATMLAVACAEYQRIEAEPLWRVAAGLDKGPNAPFGELNFEGPTVTQGAPVLRTSPSAATLLTALAGKLLLGFETRATGVGDLTASSVDP